MAKVKSTRAAPWKDTPDEGYAQPVLPIIRGTWARRKVGRPLQTKSLKGIVD